MNNYNDILADMIETINEGREITIFNDDIYSHFYKNDDKIISCDKDGYPTKEFDNLELLLNDLGINKETYHLFDIEMY